MTVSSVWKQALRLNFSSKSNNYHWQFATKDDIIRVNWSVSENGLWSFLFSFNFNLIARLYPFGVLFFAVGGGGVGTDQDGLGCSLQKIPKIIKNVFVFLYLFPCIPK